MGGVKVGAVETVSFYQARFCNTVAELIPRNAQVTVKQLGQIYALVS